MSDALALAEEIEELASMIERVAAPVGRAIDAVAFAGAPPRIVTFEAIDRAIHAAITTEPQKEESLEPIRYCDRLVVGEDLEEDFELTSQELLEGAAYSMRGAAETLRARGPVEAAPDVEPVRAIARYIVFHVVTAAQLVGQQLLVVDLASAIGADPVPLPGQLAGDGSA